MFNIVLDFGIGLVPILGDVVDALFRANTRNAVELEKFLRQKGAKALKAQGQRTPPLDPTDPDEFDRHTRDELGPPPQYTNAPQGSQGGRSGNPMQAPAQPPRPEPAATQGSGWMGRSKQPDLERGPLSSSPNDDPRRNQSTLQKTRR